LTYAATGRDGDLNCVPAGLADIFEIERLVRRFVLASVNVERSGIDRDLNAGRPVGVHGPVFVMETL